MYGIDLIKAQRGLISWLAPQLGLTQGALSNWNRVPAERAFEIEKLTGIPKHLLRPDLWVPPWRDQPETLPYRRRRIKKTNIENLENANSVVPLSQTVAANL